MIFIMIITGYTGGVVSQARPSECRLRTANAPSRLQNLAQLPGKADQGAGLSNSEFALGFGVLTWGCRVWGLDESRV